MPSKNSSLPSGLCVHVGEVNLFDDGIFGVECAFSLGDLADHAVITLNGIGGVDHSAQCRRIFEEVGESFPVIAPAPENNFVFLAPKFFCFIEVMLCHVGIDRFVNLFQVLDQVLALRDRDRIDA